VLKLQIQVAMSSNDIIIKDSENFVHLKSNVVPDWVKKLDLLKDKIHAALENPSEGVDGVKFCKPIDVPPSENK